MPRFSVVPGFDCAICQACGRDVDTGLEKGMEWRTVPGTTRQGNVCAPCIAKHDGKPQVNLRKEMLDMRKEERPMSLHEHCHIESGGLTGAALERYINRYYGHG